MIGVDFGSSEVKWFDGKNFGKGIPKGKAFTVGISSSSLFSKISRYPLCKGRKLKKIVESDVAAELSLDPKGISVAFCPVKKGEEGCEVLVFVGKKESLELPEPLSSLSQITVDVLGGINALMLNFTNTFTLVDAGKNKVAVATVEEGTVTGLEILRGGFDYHAENRQELSVIGETANGRVFLAGGGALSENFRKALREVVNFEVPKFAPFWEETPIYLNAYGLFHFKNANCKANFKGISLFSSDLLKNNRGKLLFSATSLFLSLLLITGAEFTDYLSEKRDYLAAKKAFKEKLSELLSERIVAPDIQVPQKLKDYKELSEKLRLFSPSVIGYVDAVSESVVPGIKITFVEGSVTSASFKVKGTAENEETLKRFIKKLKERFKNVSVSSKTGKEGILFTAVLEAKVEG